MTFDRLKPQIQQQILALPEPLADELHQSFFPAFENSIDLVDLCINNKELLSSLIKVCSVSEFVTSLCLRRPALIVDLVRSGDLQRKYQAADIKELLVDKLSDVKDETQLKARLRQCRAREMLRIAWRDITGWANVFETMADLSDLADASIQCALDQCHHWLSEKHGTPLKVNAEPQNLVVLGMGKLGGRELNFSSDVDLIFAYAEAGETSGARPISHEEYFTRLGRQLIQALDQPTADGFVFRIDMRLRPFGDSGPLAMSFDAMETYYQSHGREWERYAMIKARVVTEIDSGDVDNKTDDGQQLMSLLHPFVYRRYLDFGAFENIRDMKQRIAAEIKRKKLKGNVKLGQGGIREIEFIGQAFQLIRGGAEPRLQDREIIPVLRQLEQLGHLPGFVVEELCEAYEFLRNTEHRIQEYADQQTHLLPTDALGKTRLAYAMGFGSWLDFNVALMRHMKLVHEHFQQVFTAPQADTQQKQTSALAQVWLDQIDKTDSLSVLGEEGFQQAEQALALITAHHDAAFYRVMSRQGRERMDILMPLLIGAVSRTEQAELVLKRVFNLIEAIARRTSYLSLLIENPMVLSQLVKLCSVSAWISEQLAKQPILLDELFDPRVLYSPPGHEELLNDLEQRMNHVDADDLERQMDVLRHFKNANVLRVAAADIAEAMPLMVVSDHLTDIAEIIINRVLRIAWQYVVQRHGLPLESGKAIEGTHFAVIAYGKLGGIELGYGSDLDLVFIYDVDPNGSTTGKSDGKRSVANAVFYARLGQRMIHILTAVTSAGVLYEVDMRLRPSGSSGLLVSHVASYEDYQSKQAWTWEHQALVRARAVAGDAAMISAFNDIRQAVLCKHRDIAELQGQVRDMRERMRKELDRSQMDRHQKKQFDLKQGLGGIADIEFMVQYAVLGNAENDPSLIEYSDTIRILQAMLEKGLIGQQEGQQLADIYRDFRSRIHRKTLQQEAPLVAIDEVSEQVASVRSVWKKMML